MDQPRIQFGELLIQGRATETVHLVNKEHIPFSFSFDKSSFQTEGQMPVFTVHPLSGVVGPNTSVPVVVTFQPLEEDSFNRNIVCNIKRKQDPVILNVKGHGYNIHADLVLEDAVAIPTRRVLNLGIHELVDFGRVQVQEERSYTLKLANRSHFPFDFAWQIRSGAGRQPARPANKEPGEVPPYITISPMLGVAAKGEETEIKITYSPKESHTLDGTMLRMLIPSGPKESSYLIDLSGSAKRPSVDFSFMTHDFGPCFVTRGGTSIPGEPTSPSHKGPSQETVMLAISNRDDADCVVSCTFQRTPYLDVQLDSTMIGAGQSIRVPVVFCPREYTQYRELVEFVVNDFTKTNIEFRGSGCPLRLELVDMKNQTVDFGITTGNVPVNRSVRLVNRSLRTVEFELKDPEDRLFQREVSWTPASMIPLRPKEQIQVDLNFQPTYRHVRFKEPLLAKIKDVSIEVPLLMVAGECHATEIRLSELSYHFGQVVTNSKAFKEVHLHNFGDLGAKFHIEIIPRGKRSLATDFSVSPSEGFVAPATDVVLTVTYNPKRNQNIHTTAELRCVLENHEPVQMTLTGQCVGDPEKSDQPLIFSDKLEVRGKDTKSFTVKNSSTEEWRLQPLIKRDYEGSEYFSCPSELVVPAGGQATVDVVYHPLTMTRTPEQKAEMEQIEKEKAEKEEAEQKRAEFLFGLFGDREKGIHGLLQIWKQEGDQVDPGTRESIQALDKSIQELEKSIKDRQKELRKRPTRPEKHEGVVFVGTPDGSALVYNLEGVAGPPAVDTRQVTEVPCKTPKMQAVKISNWLNQRQRFSVTASLISPAPDSEEAKSIKINAVDTYDLFPPGLERDYKFSVFAYRTGEATIQLHFESPDSGEWYDVEVPMKFTEAQSLCEIDLKTACRQLVRHPITVANPMSTPVNFSCQTNNPEICFEPEKFEVPAGRESTLDLLFRPVQVGSGESEITLVDQTGQLGSYPYSVKFNVTPPGLERTVAFKAPLGASVIETFTFHHFAQKPGVYTASIQPAPGHKGPASNFTVETKDIKPAAATSSIEGVECNVEVKFQPSVLAEVRALLVLSSPDCADYKALLMGYTQPPQPQGPIVLGAGKPGQVEFMNPFDTAESFNFQVDNPSFQLNQRNWRGERQAKVNIAITFKPDAGGKAQQQGCLIITNAKANAPWKFFLKGE